MVKWLTRIALVGLIVILAFKVKEMLLSDENKIRDRLASLEKIVSKSASDGGTQLLIKSQRLPDLLHDPCILELPDYDVDTQFTPRQAAAELARMHARLAVLTVRFMDIEINLAKNQATVNCTTRVEGNDQLGTESGKDTVEMVCELRKSDQDNQWRFTRFHQVDVLKR